MNTIRLMLVDDHSLIRDSWKLVFSTDRRFQVVAETGNSGECMELVKTHAPDIVIMDINMPGLTGIEATEMIRSFSNVKILCVTAHSNYVYVKKVMQKGASGYLTKNAPLQEFFLALTELACGRKYIAAEIKNHLAEMALGEESHQPSIHDLSGRELEIIQFVRKGWTSKEIAEKLFVSKKTVEVHRYNVLRKLNLKNAAALIDFMNKSDLAVG